MAAWTCPACRVERTTPYCPECGERPFRPHELTARGLLDQSIQAFSTIDGRVLRSFRDLVFRPGALTMAYLEGRRKPFIAPLQLFLLVNVLFFALQSATGIKVFTTTLQSHLHDQMWSDLARRLVSQRLDSLHTTLDLYAPLFDRAVALHAKSLVVLMVLPFALLPAILFHRSRRPFAVQVVFSLHMYAFLLALFCALLGAIVVSVMLGGPSLEDQVVDKIATIVWLVVSAVYLGRATAVVYGARGVSRVFQTFVLVAAVAALVLGYRFVIFLITLYTT